MILLDTNVISELMKPLPDEAVKGWVGRQKSAHLAVSAITIAEIQYGILLLPQGKRRLRLQANFEAFIDGAFLGRVFAFDEAAAYVFGEIAAERKKSGFNTDSVDLMIAAIARHNKADIATRNVRDFEGCGIGVVNPWLGF
ncbi:MAG: type II toxin-antitoxin system VapC family toxin [Alphaproteobacteria bacterium]|nr:type II toxin-antitoxin system VapC family toxin [Alphaproteobacteria bacterium]